MILFSAVVAALRNGIVWLAGDLFARLLILMTSLCGLVLTAGVAVHGLLRSEEDRRSVRQTQR